MDAIRFDLEPHLSVEEFVDVLVRSTLSERRPIHDRDTIQEMLTNASVIVTARSGSLLVGVARSISDFSYCTYLSDLAVDVAFQKRGIGRTLITKSHEHAGRHTMLILLSAPSATTYYPHIGMRQHDSCWITDREPRQSSISR